MSTNLSGKKKIDKTGAKAPQVEPANASPRTHQPEALQQSQLNSTMAVTQENSHYRDEANNVLYAQGVQGLAILL